MDCLHNFGLQWDGEVYYQSQHSADYAQAIKVLQAREQLYTCTCTRQQLSEHPGVYPGFCRDKALKTADAALRIISADVDISFTDRCQGEICENPARQHGDFVIKRRDGIYAYQLAVVVDDYQQQVNHIVRGYDLLDSTPKQIFLQHLLGFPTPEYLHVPIIVNQQREKLSKQTLAEAADTRQPAATLWRLLELLKQNPPASLRTASVSQILDWGVAHWRPEALQKIRAIQSVID